MQENVKKKWKKPQNIQKKTVNNKDKNTARI